MEPGSSPRELMLDKIPLGNPFCSIVARYSEIKILLSDTDFGGSCQLFLRVQLFDIIPSLFWVANV